MARTNALYTETLARYGEHLAYRGFSLTQYGFFLDRCKVIAKQLGLRLDTVVEALTDDANRKFNS
jgi:hypothetical protein